MTTAEIIKGLKAIRTIHNGKYATYIDEAVHALEQEPCDDAISRREAIKMFTYDYKGERIPDYDWDNFPTQISFKDVKKLIRELPSVKT